MSKIDLKAKARTVRFENNIAIVQFDLHQAGARGILDAPRVTFECKVTREQALALIDRHEDLDCFIKL